MVENSFSYTIYKPFKKFISIINKRFYDTDPLVKTFGIFGIINYPLFYLLWNYIFTAKSTNLGMRFTITVLCIALVLNAYWPQNLKKHLPLVWYFTVTFALPFFGTYMFLLNHASVIWLTNVMLILFWLILSIDWISFMIVLPIGVSLGFLYYYLTIGPIVIFTPHIYATISNYLWAIVIGAVFSRNREVLQRQKLKGMTVAGASIAHELRTPLSTINAGASGASDIMPKLLSAYQLAQKSNLPVPAIRPSRIAGLSSTLSDIQAETRHAHNIIDMLLMKVNDPNLNNFATEISSMKHCINETLHRYPLTDEQQRWIKWQNNSDFSFKGNELLIMHVLFNLLKNAVYYVRAAGKGDIQIWLEPGKRHNRLHFKDTGRGIPSRVLPHIFDRFYSETENGTGLGLAFCKLVMHSIDGDIRCDSKFGEYTEFVMWFPAVREVIDTGA